MHCGGDFLMAPRTKADRLSTDHPESRPPIWTRSFSKCVFKVTPTACDFTRVVHHSMAAYIWPPVSDSMFPETPATKGLVARGMSAGDVCVSYPQRSKT